MSTTFLRPCQVELLPSNSPSAQSHSHLFTIRALYKEGGNWQVYPLVYVSDEALQLFWLGQITGIHLEALKANDTASRALREGPASVVLGIEMHDGTCRSTTPMALLAIRRKRLIQGAILSIAGLGIVSATTALWLGIAALTSGTHVLRSALAVPIKPFWPPSSSRRLT